MKDIDRKARIREYKETPRPAGVYRILNTVTGKSLIGTSADLPAILNRQRFQLEHGSHPDKALQGDWNKLGPAAFEFQELDRLEPQDEPSRDPAEDLAALRDLWLEKLTAAGEALY
ncbi:MAG: GIY-YIG nuclease family protein [Thermoleophilia bacterium]|nr:GIY-YIG nuclease family protein [Thermoleophilia bacterium]